MKRWLILLLSLAMALGMAHADEIHLEGVGLQDSAVRLFQEAHPEVTIHPSPHTAYFSTTQLVGQLISGEFAYDVFTMESDSFDIGRLIEKGYCAELPATGRIGQELSRMYGSIFDQVSRNGKIYAVPCALSMRYLMYDPAGWEAAGFTEADVPTSFPELLDFLERWVERIAEEPEDNISVSNMFDETRYHEGSYVLYLTDLLMDHYMMQMSFAGEPLRFQTPLFRDLLERCRKIGMDLYRYEPIHKGEMQLLMEYQGMRDLDKLVPLRLTEDQPVLIHAGLRVHMLNAASKQKELAIDYLEDVLSSIEPRDAVYLYRDAVPVEEPTYQSNLKNRLDRIASIRAQLEDDTQSLAERETLEFLLENAQLQLERYQTPEHQYVVLEDDLRLDRAYGENLYFQPPSALSVTTENGQNMQQLRDLFCSGQLPLEQFIARLDELAWMVETENQ